MIIKDIIAVLKEKPEMKKRQFDFRAMTVKVPELTSEVIDKCELLTFKETLQL